MAWYDGLADFGTKAVGGLGDLGTWAFGSDGIGGESGAIGGVGDWLTGTAGNRVFDSKSGNWVGSEATPGLLSTAGNWLESNPETAKLGLGVLGGLADYGLQKDAQDSTNDRFNQQMALSQAYQDRQFSDADAAEARRKEAELAFQQSGGSVNGSQALPYAR